MRLLIGGSPCTHWSIAQKNNRETEPGGLGWELFKNFLIAKEKFKPDYFLYENNKSAAQPIKDQISRELQAPLQYINSALVSAQNRQRFYCHNILGVSQPADRGILLKDILESGVDLSQNEKGYALTTRCQGAIPEDTIQKHRHSMVAEPIRIGDIGSNSQAHRVYSAEGKSVTVNAGGGGQGGKTGLYACPINTTENGKAQCLRASYYKDGIRNLIANNVDKKTCVAESWDGKTYPVYEVKNGLITIKDKQYPIKLPDGYYIIRKLTIKECMRLQTVRDNYIFPVSNSQAYKMLGNGWTVEVIKHILSYIPDIANCTVEVLSMYDGMSCGQIALTELGCKIDRYVSYEIDKYAIQTTKANFPQTEQRGDAFQVRQENWTY